MNKLFEDFGFESLRQCLVPTFETRDRWDQGRTIRLDEENALRPKPDLSLSRGPRCLFIGDVKYKLTDEGLLSHLYQLLAYCTATDLESGLLIYAAQPTGLVQHQSFMAAPPCEQQALTSPRRLPQSTRLDELAARIREVTQAG